MIFRRKTVIATISELTREMKRFSSTFSTDGTTLDLITGVVAALRGRGPKLAQRFQEAARALRETGEVEQRAIRTTVVSTGTLAALMILSKALNPVITLGPNFDPGAHEAACNLKDSIDQYLQVCEG